MTIGERIRYRRKQLGLSADDLAAKLNKNRATIYRYESDEIEKLPASVLESLALALDVTPAYLMGWEDNDTDLVNNKQLTPTQKEFIELLDAMPEDKQQMLLQMIKALVAGM